MSDYELSDVESADEKWLANIMLLLLKWIRFYVLCVWEAD